MRMITKPAVVSDAGQKVASCLLEVSDLRNQTAAKRTARSIQIKDQDYGAEIC